MLSKNQTKYINSLKIKKFRQEHGAFIVEGEKCVGELLHSNMDVVAVYAIPAWLHENIHTLRDRNIAFDEVDETGLEKISDLTTPNKVLALAKIPEPELSPDVYQRYILALDNIKDPGNMGTIIRSADWFGIRQVVCSPGCVDAYNPKVVQATMGSFTRVNIFQAELVQFIKQSTKGTPVYGALLNGESLYNIAFKNAGIIVIGSESHGISDELLPFITQAVHVPSYSQNEALTKPESLNASIANAIICYEIAKQLSEKKLG